jgi:nucleotide-binding universal stress UspA family protein
MGKRFIILIDFSVQSSGLIQYAHSWACQVGASLLLLHRIEAVPPVRADEATRDVHASRLMLDAAERLEQLSRTLLPGFAAVSHKVVLDTLVTAVTALLSEPYDNLVVVGLKSSAALRKILIGSETVRLVNHTNGILVAIPHAVTHFSPSRVFVAVSTEFALNRDAFERALGFLGEGIEALTFFYLSGPDEQPDAVIRLLDTLAAEYSQKYPVHTAIYHGEHRNEQIKLVINNQIEEILIVQRGSRMLTDKLFRTFTINELVHEGRTPLMVLPFNPVID